MTGSFLGIDSVLSLFPFFWEPKRKQVIDNGFYLYQHVLLVNLNNIWQFIILSVNDIEFKLKRCHNKINHLQQLNCQNKTVLSSTIREIIRSRTTIVVDRALWQINNIIDILDKQIGGIEEHCFITSKFEWMNQDTELEMLIWKILLTTHDSWNLFKINRSTIGTDK